MSQRTKIPKSEHAVIVHDYSDGLCPMIELAERYGVTRMAIYNILKANGAETRKSKSANRVVECPACGKLNTFKRSRLRYARRLYCNRACYTAWLNRRSAENPMVIDRTGRRRAKKVVGQFMLVRDFMVIHHEDRDETNNEISNLRVFKNSADHIKYHRDVLVTPIWDGRDPENVPERYVEEPNKYIS